LGALPIEKRLREVVEREKVTATLNLCEEWRGNQQLYRELRVTELHLPVIDYTSPTIQQIEAGVNFLLERAARGETVYGILRHNKTPYNSH